MQFKEIIDVGNFDFEFILYMAKDKDGNNYLKRYFKFAGVQYGFYFFFPRIVDGEQKPATCTVRAINADSDIEAIDLIRDFWFVMKEFSDEEDNYWCADFKILGIAYSCNVSRVTEQNGERLERPTWSCNVYYYEDEEESNNEDN